MGFEITNRPPASSLSTVTPSGYCFRKLHSAHTHIFHIHTDHHGWWWRRRRRRRRRWVVRVSVVLDM
jgi:hypothetical protein